jgi:hypothetical protein
MISLGELAPSDTAVIREVYDSDNAQELFEMELERALQVRNRYFFKYHLSPLYRNGVNASFKLYLRLFEGRV